MMIGAGMAVLIALGILIVILRYTTDDNRLLVLQRDSVLPTVRQVEKGDRIRVTGVIRRFGFARGFDGQTPGDTDGKNALEVISIANGEGVDAEGTLDVEKARNDENRQGDRVIVQGEVKQVIGDNFFTLVE